MCPWWRHQMEIFAALLAICAGTHWSPVNSPHKGQWRGALMFSFICTWINGWVNNRDGGDLIRHRTHYDVIVMPPSHQYICKTSYPTRPGACGGRADRPQMKPKFAWSRSACEAWWRHQIETFSALLAFCAGSSPVTVESPLTKASSAELWCFLWSAPE